MSQNTVCLDTELRKLRPAELYTLGQILNIYDSWKKLMAIIPKKENCELPKFNTDHFSMIEQAAQQQKRNAAEIFLAEWGTMGKQRPTLRVLLNLLVKAELFRAADYVAGDILKEELPKRPECGPAAPVDVSDEEIQNLLKEKLGSQDIDFNESLIFGLPSDADDNEMINPNAVDNVMNDNTLERNMQSTKLVSMKEKHNKTFLRNVRNQQQEITEMSDLMKFTNEHNMEECRVYTDFNGSNKPVNTFNTDNSNSQEYVFKKQELSSSNLPVFLNEFGQNMKQAKLNEEVMSDELPAFLINSMPTSNSNLQINSINNSLNFCNLNLNENEVVSAELPQCIVELAVNPDNIVFNEEKLVQNTLNSQEIPITVLEHNDSYN